ncbi:hypothetical protein BST61_g3544 [Cercospora zeina]
MSLARAFTTKRDANSTPNFHLRRAATQRTAKPIKRCQISSPVALISTTNPLSYDAPNIAGTTPIRARNVTATSTTSSTGEDSDAPSLSFDGTDTSSIDETPMTPEPEPNHLSCYFKPAVDTKTANRSGSATISTPTGAPVLPQRVPSHSKSAHENIHRKRSVQRLMSPPPSILRRQSTEFFSMASSFVDTPSEINPFGYELAQLDAVAEEMSHAVRDAEAEEDKIFMDTHGLACFGIDDYMLEIKSLVCDYLVEQPVAPVWI